MSNISKDLLLAILALDAYNRGYGAGISDLSQKSETKVGPARIITNAEKELGEGEAQSAGFYAIAYELDKAVEGLPKGSVIISYRGTDDYGVFSLDNDIWGGWSFGGGWPISDQLDLAEKFYEAVFPGKNTFEGKNGPIFTGHSLGGGLAGYMASLTHSKALVFDHEPFALVTVLRWLNELYKRGVTNVYEAIGILKNRSSSTLGIAFPEFSSIEAIYVDGEVLEPVRKHVATVTPGSLVIALAGLLTSPALGALGLALSGVAIAGEAATKYKQILPYFGGISLSDFINRHSMSLLVIEKFGVDIHGEKGPWIDIFEEVYQALFSNEIGLAAGFPEKKKQGVYEASSKLMAAIAYFDTVADAQRRELATKLQERADDLRHEAAGLRSLAERITSQWPEKGYLASSATHSAEQLAEAA